MTPETTVAIPHSEPDPWQWTESVSDALGPIHTAITLAPTGAAWQATVHKIADGWAYSIDDGTVQGGELSLFDQVIEGVGPFVSPDEAKDHLAQWSNYLIAEYVAAELEMDAEANDQPVPTLPAVPQLVPSPIPTASDIADPARWHVLSPICLIRFFKSGDTTLRLLVTQSPTEVEFIHRYGWQWSIDVETGADMSSLASGFAKTAYAARQLALASAASYDSIPDALRR